MSKFKYIIKSIALAAVLGTTAGCSDWLSPKPLSFYTPENAFINYRGLKAGTDMLNRDVRYLEYYPTAFSAPPALLTELVFSDVAVNGMTDSNNPPQDLIRQIIPSADLNSAANAARCQFYWKSLYKGIKDANTIISRAGAASYESDAQKNEIYAEAFFHRAWRYYRLVHQFGDVPLITTEVTTPRFDFFTTKREVILKLMKKNLDEYAAFLPEQPMLGKVGQGAAYHLLTKINLALGEFEDAVASASKVIDGGYHQLMTERFGVKKSDETKNVIFDLHWTDNKALPENKEVLYIVLDKFDTEAATPTGLEIMRNTVPWYSASNQLKTPNGKPAFIDNNESKNPYLVEYGRGIGTLRNTWYHTNMIWTLDDTDLRHDRKSGNWMDMEDLTYNNPDLKGTEWYGKKLKKGETLCSDTIRDWYAWPNYKVNVPDQKPARWRGGNGDWYVFRLAETYLLRAEAYVWLNQLDKAAEDLNKIRERAQAAAVAPSEITMRTILDERARELFYEEPRKTELTRIAYIYAETGKTAYNGKTYKMEEFDTKNFFFDHITLVTDFYNKGVTTLKGNTYTMAPYHVLWPIPETAISANVQGHINQNKGYQGAETNIEPWDKSN